MHGNILKKTNHALRAVKYISLKSSKHSHRPCRGGIRRIQTFVPDSQYVYTENISLFHAYARKNNMWICTACQIVTSCNDLAGSYPTFDP